MNNFNEMKSAADIASANAFSALEIYQTVFFSSDCSIAKNAAYDAASDAAWIAANTAYKYANAFYKFAKPVADNV